MYTQEPHLGISAGQEGHLYWQNRGPVYKYTIPLEPKVLVVTWRRWNQFLSLESTLATMLHNVPSFGCS
jgi:hypothetical protein